MRVRRSFTQLHIAAVAVQRMWRGHMQRQAYAQAVQRIIVLQVLSLLASCSAYSFLVATLILVLKAFMCFL